MSQDDVKVVEGKSPQGDSFPFREGSRLEVVVDEPIEFAKTTESPWGRVIEIWTKDSVYWWDGTTLRGPYPHYAVLLDIKESHEK